MIIRPSFSGIFKSGTQPILTRLGINAGHASSMTRPLVAGASTTYTVPLDSDPTKVFKIIDQSGNGFELRTWTTTKPAYTDSNTGCTLSTSAAQAMALEGATVADITYGTGTDVYLVGEWVATHTYMMMLSDRQSSPVLTRPVVGFWSTRTSTASPNLNVTNTAGSEPTIEIDGTALSPQTQGELNSQLSVGGNHLMSAVDLDMASFTSTRGFGLGTNHSWWKLSMTIREFIICPTLSTADRAALTADIKEYYDIS